MSQITALLFVQLFLGMTIWSPSSSFETGTGIYLIDSDAHCLDGTVPMYWYVQGSESGQNKWLLFYEGGGLCDGLNGGVDNCYDYSVSYYGGYYGSSSASAGVTTTSNFSEWYSNYLSQDAAINPQMYNWNMVYMHYCDGGLWTGSVQDPVPVNSGANNIYFQGEMISQSILADLISTKGLSAASDVVVSGSSAGGVAVYSKVASVARLLQAYPAKVVGLADSGFMLANNTGSCQFESQLEWLFDNMNSSAALLSSCLDAQSSGQKYRCMFPQYSVPYLSYPLFAIQSRDDSYQYLYILCEYGYGSYATDMNQAAVASYGRNIAANFYASGMGAGNKGALLDSCPHHYVIYNTTFLRYFNPWNTIAAADGTGLTQQQAFAYWYNGDSSSVLQGVNFTQTPPTSVLDFSYCTNAQEEVSSGDDNNDSQRKEIALAVGLSVALAVSIVALFLIPRRFWQTFCCIRQLQANGKPMASQQDHEIQL